jgi:hypothetical protein
MLSRKWTVLSSIGKCLLNDYVSFKMMWKCIAVCLAIYLGFLLRVKLKLSASASIGICVA